ncbi:class I SAM-dependent methyltransferase [Qipengyuania nanhaisediminis]|uniref:class I SAM-dependent methyltransferase n=1 Tax=Qipengyuania nanhaisediminis TaxID=604088 RepID=UPI0038B3D3D1
MNVSRIRGEQLLRSGRRFSAEPGLIARALAPGFGKMLDRLDAGIEKGSLLGHLPDGTTRLLGGRNPGFDVEVRLKDWRALIRLASLGAIGWFQAYEAGEWEADDHPALFALFSANVRTLGNTARASGPFRLAARIAHALNRNNRAGAQRNIAAHYDLGNDFYRAWLDETMTYSSALDCSDDGLEAAQRRKMDAIADRLGDARSVLEIGCGWGSLADHLARRGAQVTAISLSEEQLAWAREHCDPSIDFRKQDYRDTGGQYDAIMSVEMVEALGREYWPAYMDCIARNLAPGGRAAIQFIGFDDDVFEDYANTVDFIQAYVFPGGLLIKASEFRALAEERGLSWEDQVDFGQDYAATLAEWHTCFDRAVAEGRLPEGFDARFVRLWKFYLDYCEGGFRAGTINVHQVTLVKN